MRESSKQLLDAQGMKKLRKADSLIQHYHLANQKRCNLQLKTILSQDNKTIFIDQYKKYVIVQYQYLLDLQNSISSSQRQMESIQKTIQTEICNKAELNKLIQLRDKTIQQLQTSQKHENLKHRQLQKIIRQSESTIAVKQMELTQFKQKYQNILHQKQYLSNIKKSYELMVFSGKTDQINQTQFQKQFVENRIKLNSTKYAQSKLDQINKMTHQQQQHRPACDNALAQIYEAQIMKLKQNFSKILQEIKQQTSDKLQKIKQQKMNVQQWASENKRLKKQNQGLKNLITKINEQEQKLKIWKTTLQNYVSGVQKYHSMQQNQLFHSFNQQSKIGRQINAYSNQQKIKILMATIDQLKLDRQQRSKKINDIKFVFDSILDPSTVSEQNIISTLLNLSAKVKQALKFLLQQM